ncbi:phosphotransferase [Arthrobacter oryzae]|uniref:Aminoglycoside phosphotransferase domain-containing protein n=1 Tax=Arthrobacter oryzae TaxID=409290 RepID=A0A3N0CA94_9MICC|nr:phosphotransferase [Arthrobacter oryzae]RNL60229.1 hypothetical protein D7003_01530 [Arthrobacter oryzae]
MSWHPDIPLQLTDAAGALWQVRRAWPEKSAGEYSVEVVPRPAPASPGFETPPDAPAAKRGRAAAGVRAGHVRHGMFSLVPLADPRLPSLAAAAAGGEVVVHRAHKRAVVHAGDRYIKVLRPGYGLRVAESHASAADVLAGGFFDTPRLLASGSDVVVFSSIPGRSYLELGQDHTTVTEAGYAAMWGAWSRAWVTAARAAPGRALRTTAVALPEHPAGAEVDTLRRWTGHWLTHSDGIPEASQARAALLAQRDHAVGLLVSSRPDPPAWAHGDLHDKQLLSSGGPGAPGLVDFDGSCIAEPALDLANLDVHLELRRLQHRLTVRRYRIAHGHILAVAEQLRVSPERFAAYAAATRVRLACLYAFRPPWGPDAGDYLVRVRTLSESYYVM